MSTLLIVASLIATLGGFLLERSFSISVLIRVLASIATFMIALGVTNPMPVSQFMLKFVIVLVAMQIGYFCGMLVDIFARIAKREKPHAVAERIKDKLPND